MRRVTRREWLHLVPAWVVFTTRCDRGCSKDRNIALAADDVLVVRTDFSDDRAWNAIRMAIREPSDVFVANVRFVDERPNAGLTTEQLVAHFHANTGPTFLFVADRTAMERPDHPLLVVDLFGERGRTFRAILAQIGAIENNLSIGNMDFEEFANAVDVSGVFRGFPK